VQYEARHCQKYFPKTALKSEGINYPLNEERIANYRVPSVYQAPSASAPPPSSLMVREYSATYRCRNLGLEAFHNLSKASLLTVIRKLKLIEYNILSSVLSA
jgi:hypothetical protein